MKSVQSLYPLINESKTLCPVPPTQDEFVVDRELSHHTAVLLLFLGFLVEGVVRVGLVAGAAVIVVVVLLLLQHVGAHRRPER